MTSILLYSCNHKVKHEIQERYRRGIHFVWCSEYYDARQHSGVGARVGVTSNPAQIMRRMMESCYPNFDSHDKITLSQIEGIRDRALSWWDNNEISENDFEEILALTGRSDTEAWRPLLYVIPVTPSLRPRIETVPVGQRAAVGVEFRIADLRTDEFHVIQPDLVQRYV